MDYPNDQGNPAGAIPVYITSGSGAASTPAALLANTVATGATAVIVATGPINGGYVTNPYAAASQGLGSAENLYIDMVGTPGHTDATAFGTTFALLPGQTFNLPTLASGVNVRVNAATSGHQFSGVIL